MSRYHHRSYSRRESDRDSYRSYHRPSGRASPTYNDPVELPASTQSADNDNDDDRVDERRDEYENRRESYHDDRSRDDEYDTYSRRSRDDRHHYGGYRSRDHYEPSHRRHRDHHYQHYRSDPYSYSPGRHPYDSPGYMVEPGRRRTREEYEYTREDSAYSYDRKRRRSRSRSGSRYDTDEYRSRRYERDDRMDDREEEEEEDVDEPVDALQVYQNLITAIGDNGPQAYQKHLSGLVENIDANDIETFETEIIDTIIECASHLPHKTPVYGTLAALLNEAFPKSFGSGLSERVVKYLESAYNAGDFTRAKVTLRFIGSMCMAQMFSGDDWMELANAAIGMAKVSEDSFIADCYTYTVLGSLPWAVSKLSHDAAQKLGELMASLENLTHASNTESSTSSLASRTPSEINKSIFDELKRAYQSENPNWKIECIPQVHNDFDRKLSNQKKQTLPSLSLQPVDTLVPFVRADFDIDTIPTKQVAGIEQLCLLEMCSDIMYFFGSDISLCSKTLYHLVEHFGPMYKVPDRRVVEHLLVQSICAHLFMQPISPFKPIFYSLLTIRLLPEHDNISAELVETISWLFDNADRLDAEVRHRLAEFFAFQMNYFQFKWDWEDLDDVMDLDTSDVRRIFVQQCLHEIENLSFIHLAVDQDFLSLRGKMIEKDRSPNIKYAGPVANKDVAGQLQSFFQQRDVQRRGASGSDDTSEIERILSQIPSEEENERISVLVNVLLMNSANLYQLDLISVNSVMQKMVSDSEIKQKTVLDVICEYWEKNVQKQALVIHNFHANGVLSAASIIEWATSRPKDELQKGYLWTIIHGAIDKVVHLLQTTHCGLVDSQKKLETVVEESKDNDTEMKTDSPSAEEQKNEGFASFTGSEDSLNREKNFRKRATLEKEIEQLEEHFSKHARELSNAFAALLSAFCRFVNEEAPEMDDSDSPKPVTWFVSAMDYFTQIIRQYRKLMRSDMLEAHHAHSKQLRSILDKSLYLQRCETLSYLPTTYDPDNDTIKQMLLMDTQMVEKLLSTSISQ